MRVRAGQTFALTVAALLLGQSQASGDSEGEALEDEKGEEAARASGLPAAQGDAAEGPYVRYAAEPELGPKSLNACSQVFPFCVRAKARADQARVLGALRAGEDAWRVLSRGLAFQTPDLDPVTGAFTVYLDRAEDGGEARLAARDVRGRIDRARAFGVVDERLPAGCTQDFEVARAIVHGSLLRTMPATPWAFTRSVVAEIATTIIPCAGSGWLESRVAVYQWHAALGIPNEGSHVDYTDGSALFLAFLDRKEWGAPLAPTRALSALAVSKTPFDASRFVDEPDVFDVLVTSYKDTGNRAVDLRRRTMDDTWLSFAIARVCLPYGAPFQDAFGPGAGMPTLWDVQWPSKPRRLSSGEGLAPGGTAVLRVHTKDAPKGARLRLEAEWEAHAVLRWAFVKMNADGREIARVPIASPRRGHEAQQTLVDVDGAESVLIVVTNAGDPLFPIDPDDREWEPHAFMATIAEDTMLR